MSSFGNRVDPNQWASKTIPNLDAVRHWKENLPTDLDGNSFQSNSLSILVLFLEIETFLLINKPNHLFVITWISNQIYL